MSSRTFFTSDLHLFHKKISTFCPETRPEPTVQDQVDALVERWNSQVSPHDTVWILGDVSFEFKQYEKTCEVLHSMNGIKKLITGNHDHSNTLAVFKKERLFHTVDKYYRLKKVLDKHVILFHYPIYEWENCHHGTYHLYGHVHGNVMEHMKNTRSMDVGIDAVLNYGKEPYHIWEAEEVQELLKDNGWRDHHNKNNKLGD